MEARSELRGARMSKGLVVVIAVCVTLALGITAGVVAKNLSGTNATQTHIVKSQAGPADTYTFHRTGAQLGDRIVTAPAKQLPAVVAPALGDRANDRQAAVAAPAFAVVAPALGDRANDRQAAVAAPAFADRASDRTATVAAPVAEPDGLRNARGLRLVP